MAFKFNFQANDVDLTRDVGLNAVQVACTSSIKCDSEQANNGRLCVREVKMTPAHFQRVDEVRCHFERLAVGNWGYYFIPSRVTEPKLLSIEKESPLVEALNYSSDLVTGKYEGGLKVWECAIDLVHFLEDKAISLQNLNVLEVGCGAGIPGIFALRQGAKVLFQDFNAEVIDYSTILNVIVNTESSEVDLQSQCSFLAGDWAECEQYIEGKFPNDARFDVILSSETIYNPNTYERLHKFFQCALKPNGVIYLAAKTCYFGVGGGVRQFEEFLRQRGVFSSCVCYAVPQGVKREILKLTFN